MDAGYNHNWDGNFTVTENTLLGPANFDEFCVNVPNDPRLPNAGQQQCGYYDVQPQFFGQGTLRVTNAKEFVGQNGNTKLPQRYWDGVWFSANGRLPHSITVGGGMDVGRQVDDHCFTVDIPNQPRDINGPTGVTTTWNGYNVERSWRLPRRDRLDEQPRLPHSTAASRSRADSPAASFTATRRAPRRTRRSR